MTGRIYEPVASIAIIPPWYRRVVPAFRAWWTVLGGRSYSFGCDVDMTVPVIRTTNDARILFCSGKLPP